MIQKLAIICAMDVELNPFRDILDDRLMLIRSGVGKVNAAIATMSAIHDGATSVIVAGVAGSIDPSLKLGDVVIAKHAIQYDVDVTALGYKPSAIPFAVSRWDAWTQLIEDICRAAREIHEPTHIGRILTGDRFIANRIEAKKLHDQFGGSCVDMETAAVAQTCDQMLIPWTAIRIISDDANEYAPIDFPTFQAASAEKAARIVGRFLATNRNNPSEN